MSVENLEGKAPETGSTTPSTDNAPAPEAKKEETPEIKLTSAQLKERLERAERTSQEKLLKDLGVKDAEELKAKIEAAKQAELDKLSEKERLEKQLADANQRAEEFKAIAEREAAERRADEAEKFVEREALSSGVNRDYLDVVQVKVQKFIADNFDGDSEVTTEALKPFFDDLKSKQPLLFQVVEEKVSTAPKTPDPAPTPTSKPPVKSVMDMSPAEYRAYKASLGISV